MSRQDYFILTFQELGPLTVRLAQQVTAESDTLYDKARALESWLGSDDFVYTLDEPRLPRHSPIDAFVLQIRRGHCELYASALALMMRSLGLPTRVVSGYRGGEWSDADGAYIVSRDMAHLWVEAYFLDYGWVRFDPSPQTDVEATSWLRNAGLALSRWQWRLRIFWYRRIIGYEGGFNLARLKNAGDGFIQWGLTSFSGMFDENAQQEAGGSPLSPLALPGILVALILLAVYVRLRRQARKRKSALSEAQRRALVLFGRVRGVLNRRGVDCERKTAGELAFAARNASLAQPERVEEALQIYNEARFGKRPLDKARFKQLIKRLRAARAGR
jgi:hypothetical protein